MLLIFLNFSIKTYVVGTQKKLLNEQGCGKTMPDLSDLVPFHSGQVENFNLHVLGLVQNLYKVNKIL